MTTLQLANGAVTNANLATNAVATANIQDSSVTDAKIVSVSGTKVTGTVASARNAFLLDGLSSTNFAMLSDLPNVTPPKTVPDMQVFDVPGTNEFIVPSNVTRIVVELWGGGGGGISADTNNGTGGGGGGGGGYGKQVLNVTPGSSHSVVVGSGGNPDGSGGDSGFDRLIIAQGGHYTPYQGIGGSCTNATLNITGGDGTPIASLPQPAVSHGGAAGCGGLGGAGGTLYYVLGYGAAFSPPGNGTVPGGGGAGGYYNYVEGLQVPLVLLPPGYGAHGRVVVYY